MNFTTRHLCRLSASFFLVTSLVCCTREARAGKKITSAKERMEKGDYAGAEIEYKNALDLQPGNARALRNLGLIWVNQGVSYDGAQLLSGALEKYPNDNEIELTLSRALLSMGFSGDSQKHLEKLLDRSPDNGDALMLLADSSFEPKEIAEAKKRIEESKAADQPKVMLASALLELREGSIDTGAAMVRKVLELDPKQARAHALLSAILRVQKQPEAALEPAKKAADLAGPRSEEISTYASLLMELKRRDDAVALLKEAAKSAPDYLPNWRMLGYIAFTEEKDKEAAPYLAKVLGKSPLDLEAGLLQAQIWARGNEPRKAVELLEKLSQKFPSRPNIDFPLAKAYLTTGEVNKATAALDRVLELVPGAADAVILRVRMYLKEGKASEAIDELKPIVDAQPSNRMASDLLVGAYSVAGKNPEAVALLRQQSTAESNDPAPLLQLGRLLIAEKKPTEARQAFEKVMKIAPENFTAISQLAALDEQDGNPAPAMSRVDSYLASHPDSADAHVFKARILYSRKNFAEAEISLRKSLELKAGEMDAYGLLVQILVASGRKAEAVDLLTPHLKSNPPQDIPARMQLGTLLVELGRNEEARDCFEKLAELHPEFPPAYNNLAFLYSERLSDLEKAVTNAKKARSLDPRNAAVADTLGWIEWLRGNYAEALPLLEEAATGLPEYPSAHYHMAMTHDKLGHVDLATSGLEKALAMKADFPERAAATERLAGLKSGAADLPALEKRAADQPTDATAQLQLANALGDAGRFPEALAAYDRASKANPNLEPAYLGKFKIYANELKDPTKALEAAKQARRAAPASAASAAALGTAYYLGKNYEAAYGLLKDATSDRSADSGLFATFAKTAYAFGRVDESRIAMKKALDTGLKAPEPARDFLALTTPEAAKDPQALALGKKTLAENPDSVPALMLLAHSENPPNPAAESYLKVLKLNPDFDPARKELALVLLDDPTKTAEVEKLATDARRRMTNDADLTGILAIVNFRNKKYDYSIQLLKELSAQRPLTSRENFALGMSQAASGKPADAQENLAKAISGGLSSADAASASAEMKALAEKKSDK